MKDLATYRGAALTFGPLGDDTSVPLSDNEISVGAALDGPYLYLTTDDVAKARLTIAEMCPAAIVAEVLEALAIDGPGLESGIARGIYVDVR